MQKLWVNSWFKKNVTQQALNFWHFMAAHTHRPPGHVPTSQEVSIQSVPAHPARWLTDKTVSICERKDYIRTSDSHPDADSKVEKKVGWYDDDVREAEGLTQVVEVGGGVGHPRSLQQYILT